jgi:hypothetical protein
MFDALVLYLFLRVNTQDKAQKLLGKVKKKLDVDTRDGYCRKYWKDKTLYEAKLTVPLSMTGVTEAVFSALAFCSRLAIEWRIRGPFRYNEDKWELLGTASSDTLSVQGVVFARFVLRNYGATIPDDA